MKNAKQHLNLHVVSEENPRKPFRFTHIHKGLLLTVWAGVFIAVGLLFSHFHGATKPANAPMGQTAPTLGEPAQSYSVIQVDVHGDVVHPGIVKVPVGSRVIDVIRAAGGLLHQNDANNLNEAAIVYDGEEIDVLPVGTKQVSAPSTQSTKPGLNTFSANDSKALPTQKINLNSADVSSLETLPGLGPKRAQDIVNYRTTHGPFQSVGELANVKGIGDKTLQAWMRYLYVEK